MQVNKNKKTFFSKLVARDILSNVLGIRGLKNRQNVYSLKKTNQRKTFTRSATVLVAALATSAVFVGVKTFADDWSGTVRTQTSWSGSPFDITTTPIETIDGNDSSKYSEIDGELYLDSAKPNEIKLNPSAAANKQGSLTSAVFDVGDKAYFRNIEFDGENIEDGGIVQIQARSSSKADMTTAKEWSTCKYLKNKETIYGLKDKNGEETNKCMRRPERYIQYKITLTNNDVPANFAVNKVSFEYNNDYNSPWYQLNTLQKNSSKVQNHFAYTYTWDQRDSMGFGWFDDESGVAGVKYCVSDAMNHGDTEPFSKCNPRTHPENYIGPNGIYNEDDKPEYGTFKLKEEDFKDGHIPHEYIADVFPLSENRLTTNPLHPEYKYTIDEEEPVGLFVVFVRAIDNVGNFTDQSSDSFFLDKYSTLPSGAPKDITVTNTVAGTNEFSFGWTAPGSKEHPWYVYSLQEIRSEIYDNIAELTPQELKELLESELGIEIEVGETLTPEFIEEVIDMVLEKMGVAEMADMISMFSGSVDELSYCYLINESPNPDITSTDYDIRYDSAGKPDYKTRELKFEATFNNNWVDKCERTPVGATGLQKSNYGTRQGINSLFIASINEAGNLYPIVSIPVTEEDGENEIPVLDPDSCDLDEDGEPIGDPTECKQLIATVNNYSTADFEVATLSPDLPQKPEVTDISNRTDEIWRVVLSWVKPKDDVPKVVKYQIDRSVDNSTWQDIGYTDALSYVDTDPALNNKTKYYYQVRACDNAGSCSDGIDAINVASKNKSTGITPNGHYTEAASLTANPKVTSISTKKAVIEWQTSRESDSAMFISTSSNVSVKGDYSAGNSNQISSHSLSLSNLQPDTKYYYKTTWTDIDNNTGVSPEMSFTTVAAPQFSEVDFSSISVSGSTVNFTVKDASKVNMYYGKTESFGGISVINTSTKKSAYSVNLSNLDDNSKYYIRLNGFDADGNEYSGNVNSFTTLTRPKISNLKFQPVEDAASNTTKVSWNTNVPATSILNYGIAGGKQLEIISSKLMTEHEITISGLDDNSTYSLVARSRDAYDNLATSDNQTFKTALDTRPPKISKITVDTTIRGTGAEAKGQVIVSWTTDELATSQVAFGQGAPGSYNNKTAEDSTLSYEHTVVISDLSTSSIYQVQPVSRDNSNNQSKGANQSAIVGRGTEDVFMIIFSALRNIFGIKGKL